jgi:CDP-paratose 2-epimerase
MKTACFRCGCLTGPNHSGSELHGFLAYLMKCGATAAPYSVFGYKGKQVRDNIHSADLIAAFHQFYKCPRAGEVYNMGGGRQSSCSMIEAIRLCEEITARPFWSKYVEESRRGDHIWWISDTSRFSRHYPEWRQRYGVPEILKEIYEANIERWRGTSTTDVPQALSR